jgi:hypothetical protein
MLNSSIKWWEKGQKETRDSWNKQKGNNNRVKPNIIERAKVSFVRN